LGVPKASNDTIRAAIALDFLHALAMAGPVAEADKFDTGIDIAVDQIAICRRCREPGKYTDAALVRMRSRT
jgi:hypothetical protein